MSEINALEELRTLSMVRMGGWLRMDTQKIADAIEAEIAERFIELPEGWTSEQAYDVLDYWPTWDDGSPCMFGDEFTCYPKYSSRKEYKVLDKLSIFGPDHVWNRGRDDERPHDGGYYEWNYMRPGGDNCEKYRPTKRKPRTLEDVLDDLQAETIQIFGKRAAGDIDSEMLRTEYADSIRAHADEIREMMGAQE